MNDRSHHHRPDPRRETRTRRAFMLWMAAYAAALLLIAILHGFGGSPAGIVIDRNGIRTQQARAIGEPQSSLANRMLPEVVTLRVDG